MATTTLHDYELNGTIVRYVLNEASGAVGLMLFPATMRDQVVTHRRTFAQWPEFQNPKDSPAATGVDSLVHFTLLGSTVGASFANGRTMRRSPETEALKYHSQQERSVCDALGTRRIITTVLRHPAGHTLTHELTWFDDEKAGHVLTSFSNGSDQPVELGLLTSYALGGISPFAEDDAPERIFVHRFRSNWSGEGRHESRLLEELHLERTWSGSGTNVERFGQVGSMPVRSYYPCIAVEDRVAKVVWGAQLHWAASWQMQIGHCDDQVTIDGGLADRELGHWHKTIAPGETFTSPKAVIACAAGDIDDLCDALTHTQQRPLRTLPAVEHDLPVICNDWCTTWGNPTHELIQSMADQLQGTGVRYLVIDAGWYRPDAGNWGNAQGDWVPNATAFPHGMAAMAQSIRDRGLIPGLWFEIETCGSESQAFHKTDLLLHLDGQPLTVGVRRFWDLNNPKAVDYLTERVISLIEQANFGFLKVDYNDAIGIGVDGCESLGEGLRRQTEAMYRFYQSIKSRLPNLVIEICASGGHRQEPSMLALAAQACFSDSHECREIPIIAANLHRLMLPRQSQVWSVLRARDADQRLVYSLAATFLGRMCISGDICTLSPHQWEIVRQAIALYRTVTPVIRDGVSRRQGDYGPSWRHAHGWQAVVRTHQDRALVVVHTFEKYVGDVTVQLPPGDWRITDAMHTLADGPAVGHGNLTLLKMDDFRGAVIVLERAKP